MHNSPNSAGNQTNDPRRLGRLTRSRTTTRPVPWQKTAIVAFFLLVSLLFGNVIWMLLAAVPGVFWLLAAKYSTNSEMHFRQRQQHASAQTRTNAGNDHRPQPPTRKTKTPSLPENLAASVIHNSPSFWLITAGVTSLVLAGWVLTAVVTDPKPGRKLLGDFLYEYWPLQPNECRLLGAGLVGLGLLLTGLSAPCRRWLAVRLLRIGNTGIPAAFQNPFSELLSTQGAAATEAAPQHSTTISAPPMAVPQSQPTFMDHHGI
jgi:hypothetical protein